MIGGFAVSARAEPRFTRDLDLAVAVDDDTAAEELVHSLSGAGYRLLSVVEQQAVGRLAIGRLAAPGAGHVGLIVDLVFASAGIESEIAEAAERLEILPGLVFPVARTGHLVALKLLAWDDTRPQDAADLRALAPVVRAEDRETARSAVALIAKRGFDRGRPLVAMLDDYLASI